MPLCLKFVLTTVSGATSEDKVDILQHSMFSVRQYNILAGSAPIKNMPLSQYKKSHFWDKTILLPSNPNNLGFLMLVRWYI